MKATETLQKEAEKEIESEKEQTIREVLKEHALAIENAAADIETAKDRYEKAEKKYKELLKDRNLLMRLCLQKVTAHPVKKKDED